MCTEPVADGYKDKIRQSCLRVIERAERLKKFLSGIDVKAVAKADDNL